MKFSAIMQKLRISKFVPDGVEIFIARFFFSKKQVTDNVDTHGTKGKLQMVEKFRVTKYRMFKSTIPAFNDQIDRG